MLMPSIDWSLQLNHSVQSFAYSVLELGPSVLWTGALNPSGGLEERRRTHCHSQILSRSSKSVLESHIGALYSSRRSQHNPVEPKLLFLLSGLSFNGVM